MKLESIPRSIEWRFWICAGATVFISGSPGDYIFIIYFYCLFCIDLSHMTLKTIQIILLAAELFYALENMILNMILNVTASISRYLDFE